MVIFTACGRVRGVESGARRAGGRAVGREDSHSDEETKKALRNSAVGGKRRRSGAETSGFPTTAKTRLEGDVFTPRPCW